MASQIKDNVHGLIEFEPICMRIIDTLQVCHLNTLSLFVAILPNRPS